jgi:hypothetical protein
MLRKRARSARVETAGTSPSPQQIARNPAMLRVRLQRSPLSEEAEGHSRMIRREAVDAAGEQ